MSVTSENEVSTTSLWSSLDTSDNSSWTEALVTVNILFLAFVLIVVSLRAFTKLFLATRLFIDDCKHIIMNNICCKKKKGGY